MLPRLLVYTPTYDDAMAPACRTSVLAQEYGGYWIWVTDDVDPYPPPNHRNVLAKYRRARTMALEDGYDALVTVEHDMVLPVDALTRLAATTDADVVYATYVLRHGSNVLNLFQRTGGRNIGQSLSLHPADLAAMRRAGQGRVSGVGWGCTLIWRRVLEQIEFGDDGGENPAGDLAFAAACHRAGMVAVGRLDVPCWHIDNGTWLYPWRDGMANEVECLAQQTVTVLVGASSMKLERGQWYNLPAATATELQRAGYVKIFESKTMETATIAVERETAVARRKRS